VIGRVSATSQLRFHAEWGKRLLRTVLYASYASSLQKGLHSGESILYHRLTFTSFVSSPSQRWRIDTFDPMALDVTGQPAWLAITHEHSPRSLRMVAIRNLEWKSATRHFYAEKSPNLHLTLRSRQRLQAVEALGPFFSADIFSRT
jgi:hypothetical protein